MTYIPQKQVEDKWASGECLRMKFSFTIYVIIMIFICGDMIMNLLIRIYNIYVLQICDLVPIMVIGSSDSFFQA
jgi:hypothetical protein